MKVVMINDCAFVGETILKYLPSHFEKVHIKRTRKLWSKTFGIAYALLKIKGDIYHANYLLQDCYVASKFGKHPLVGHAHGSDLRSSIKHLLWSRIIRHNLKHCDKILVSTPDVLEQAREFRKDAEYLPNPVDTELFYPKPIVPHSGKQRVLIASDSNWKVKGTHIAIKALSKIKDEVDVSIIKYGKDFDRTMLLASSLGLHLNVLPKVTHEKINEYYWSADVIIDRFKLGSLGMVSLEAIACGRPVVTYASSRYLEYETFPLKDVSTEEKIADAIIDSPCKLLRKEYTYFKYNHKIDNIIQRVLTIYKTMLEEYKQPK